MVFLCALSAGAGTITSINPSTINVSSGEYFLTANGSALGSQMTFSGPAGTFTLNINSSTPTSVTAWIPEAVVNRSGSYTVTVSGSNAATLTIVNPNRRFLLLVPEVMLISAISREGTPVKFEDSLTTWSDDKDPSPATIECDPRSGSALPLGTTQVRCTASNLNGEKDSATFGVAVVDDGAPDLKVPRDIVAEATEETGAIVKFDTSAFDAIDGELRVTCNRQSGSLFPVGRTLVSCNAADFSQNNAYGSFLVEVKGKGRLALNVPKGLAVEADNADGTLVDYHVEAYGSEDPEPVVKCDPKSGDFFRFGTTLVTCHAEDRFGGVADERFEVNVVDTLGPIVA